MDIELRLEKFVYGGNALGYAQGLNARQGNQTVFVPYAFPGEKVVAHIVEGRRGYARAELVEVLEISPKRIAPRCPHFTHCGGCHYQHMSYAHELDTKTGIIYDQLKRIGRLEDPPVTPIIPSLPDWNYRNHVQFHVTHQGRLGFHAPRSNSIVPVTECHLPEGSLNAVWPRVEFESGSGIERLGMRLGESGEVMLVLEGSSRELPEVNVETDISVVHLQDEDVSVLAGNDHIVMNVLDRRFHVSPGSFFKFKSANAGRVVVQILDQLSLTPSTVVLDAYCGVGLFSTFLAPRVGKVIGIESSDSACKDFTINLEEFENVELYEAPVEQVFACLPDSPDVVLLDPPRAGLSDPVKKAILIRKPGKLVYISCDPSTLAHDVRCLVDGGYQVEQVTPFDLFPHTYHIESVSILAR